MSYIIVWRETPNGKINTYTGKDGKPKIYADVDTSVSARWSRHDVDRDLLAHLNDNLDETVAVHHTIARSVLGWDI